MAHLAGVGVPGPQEWKTSTWLPEMGSNLTESTETQVCLPTQKGYFLSPGAGAGGWGPGLPVKAIWLLRK